MSLSYTRLFIFVEGPDDERFFDRIVRPMYSGDYDEVKVVNYATKKPAKIKAHLRSIDSQKEWAYIFVSDINAAPCFSAKKEALRKRYTNIKMPAIRIVKSEIESWYLAGLTVKSSKELHIGNFNSTDHITKHQFVQMKPKRYTTIQFMLETLSRFSISTAQKKNESFKYFLDKVANPPV